MAQLDKPEIVKTPWFHLKVGNKGGKVLRLQKFTGRKIKTTDHPL